MQMCAPLNNPLCSRPTLTQIHAPRDDPKHVESPQSLEIWTAWSALMSVLCVAYTNRQASARRLESGLTARQDEVFDFRQALTPTMLAQDLALQ